MTSRPRRSLMQANGIFNEAGSRWKTVKLCLSSCIVFLSKFNKLAASEYFREQGESWVTSCWILCRLRRFMINASETLSRGSRLRRRILVNG